MSNECWPSPHASPPRGEGATPQTPVAASPRPQGERGRGRGRRGLGLLLGLLLLGAVTAVQADRPGWRRDHWDGHRGPTRYYAPGHWVSVLPPRPVLGIHGGSRYWYAEGYWYSPYSNGYRVVHPPRGMVISYLPLWAVAIPVGAVTYYLANDVYYRRVNEGYEVVEPPAGVSAGAPGAAPAPRRFVYPKDGQTSEQQADDEYDCHRWAVQQSGYDPTQAPFGAIPQPIPATAESAPPSPENYQRASQACLEGRGYVVK